MTRTTTLVLAASIFALAMSLMLLVVASAPYNAVFIIKGEAYVIDFGLTATDCGEWQFREAEYASLMPGMTAACQRDILRTTTAKATVD